MSTEPAVHRVVVASDQVLLADVLCAALADRGFDTIRWQPDPDARGEHVGLVLVDPESPTSRAYAERVVASARTTPWVMVAATPPEQTWVDTLVPARIDLVDSSIPLAELAVALHARAHDTGRDCSVAG